MPVEEKNVAQRGGRKTRPFYTLEPCDALHHVTLLVPKQRLGGVSDFVSLVASSTTHPLSLSVHHYPRSDILKSTDNLPDFAQTALRLGCSDRRGYGH